MKKNICKIFLIMTAIAFGLAGCSAEAKVERQLELGASSMEAGDYDAAIEAYEEVIALDKYEIEGYEGLVAAMIADGRSSEEIEGVVASATDIITELKESEGGLSEEDKAAAERLYINAANAVADDKDAQAAILENGAGVLEESSAIKEAYKEAADENTDETTEDAQDSTDATAGDSSNENAGDVHLVETDFGTIAYLGDNKEYPDILEDLEIYFNGQTFQMSLPKDMCAEFKWDTEINTLMIFNSDKSKVAHLLIIDTTLDIKEKNVLTNTEEMNNILTQLGYDTLTNVEVVDIENTEDTMSQRIPVNNENYVGEFMYLQTYDEGTFEFTNQKDETITCVNCIQYMFFYGDTMKESADEISSYIMESFIVIKEENSHISNLNTELNQSNKLSNDLAKKYGIPENLQIPMNAEIVDVNGMFNLKIEKTYKEDVILFLDEFNEKTKIIDKRNDILVFSTKEAIDYLDININFRGLYELNGISYSLNLSQDETYYYISIIQN
ncbi:MAG: hypothetical protein J6A73_03485 [Lachnospiraceae bacterium]|nr:hypothetical protein [Lachnospiraceae bacterium]